MVSKAKQVKVVLQDGRELLGRLIGNDPPTDIAVLQIDADNLTAISFGNSDDLHILLNKASIGKRQQLKIMREAKLKTVTVIPAELQAT